MMCFMDTVSPALDPWIVKGKEQALTYHWAERTRALVLLRTGSYEDKQRTYQFFMVSQKPRWKTWLENM